jgi:TolA-binding protein
MSRKRAAIAVAALVVALVALGGAAVARGVHHQVYRALLYAVVAKHVTAGATTTREALSRLHEYVYLNVRSPRNMRKLDDSAADTLIRGYGYCDPSSLVFVRLAEEIGLDARMLFLWDDHGNSPHTVAEVYLDGDWRVFDTLYYVAPVRPDGEEATAQDIAEHPEDLGVSRNDPEWFARARPVYEVPPSWLDTLLSGLAHRIVYAMPDWLTDALQDAYLRLPMRTYENPGYFERPSAPDTLLYLKARHLQIFGRVADAEAAYQELFKRYPDSSYVDDAHYSQALMLLTVAHQPAAAAAELATLRTQYPDSGWVGESSYLLARADQALGNCASAAALYQEVSSGKTNGQEDARRRLDALACA